VVVRDDAGGERRFQLLDGAEMEDDAAGAAVASPIGRALIGRSAGDSVAVRAPTGERRRIILSVEQYHPHSG
jgi:transcription elongation factor GreA